ncbi:AMP-binding protein [Allosaccharopolyspora coralli]|uniref:AMP-binding protein n=1 Tax=Allosaccharopolyspora coralli TaxID=2665642 RepID=A0A5Q3Q949_9PSEU|nr:long-chain-fatty-acid--CoA ligase [Allosaccharopolyspora coralli]QGK70360.1 AMP-binding protein [Allosaccharopolyspora coralli]
MTYQAEIPTVTDLLLAHTEADRAGLLFEDQAWSWREHVQAGADRAALAHTLLDKKERPHVGVLLDNVPEFSFLVAAAAFGGFVLVGLNPYRRGEALARDVRTADCSVVVTENKYAPLVDGLDLGGATVHDIDSPEWAALLEAHADSPLAPVPAKPDDVLMLVFTSGTGGAPKAARCTHAKFAFPGRMLAERFGLGHDDVVYEAMPLFHSNALITGWSVAAASGATLALRRSFSASGFLPDVRRFGATYANYVGRPLSYVLSTPEQADDADNPLRLMYGNEGARRDLDRFADRFGCHVVDAFGSTEGGLAISRTPDTPQDALGQLTDGVAVLDPDTGEPCPRARYANDGTVTNLQEATGELVNTAGPGFFTGYYRDPDADADRLRDGMYWSGDLAYVDEHGFCYFVGRAGGWLRVDGENLGTAEIERILSRHPDIAQVAVYAVPDPHVGDQVMAAVVAGPNGLDMTRFADFLGAQDDLGPKQHPSYVRLAEDLPRTATFKVLTRQLAAEAHDCADPVWWRPDRRRPYEVFARET